jgi:hypothetical protein
MNENAQQLEHEAPAFVDFDCTTPTMQAIILDYLATHAGVTFVDLEDDVPGFAGELTLRSSSNRNTILWRGVSSAAVHALCELEKHGRIAYKDTSFRIYQEKGRRIHLPIARWKSHILHWTPVYVERTLAELAE